MANNRTQASNFQSRYGGGFVSPPQYLTECLCILIAKAERKQLCDNFWNKAPWTSIFRRQVPLAVKLLKKHDAGVILAAMRDRRCWKMRSFGANWLLGPLLEEKQREQNAQVAQQSERTMTKTSTVAKPRRISKGKKSLFSQLKEAE